VKTLAPWTATTPAVSSVEPSSATMTLERWMDLLVDAAQRLLQERGAVPRRDDDGDARHLVRNLCAQAATPVGRPMHRIGDGQWTYQVLGQP
jgi:hypothetical protein